MIPMLNENKSAAVTAHSTRYIGKTTTCASLEPPFIIHVFVCAYVCYIVSLKKEDGKYTQHAMKDVSWWISANELNGDIFTYIQTMPRCTIRNRKQPCNSSQLMHAVGVAGRNAANINIAFNENNAKRLSLSLSLLIYFSSHIDCHLAYSSAIDKQLMDLKSANNIRSYLLAKSARVRRLLPWHVNAKRLHNNRRHCFSWNCIRIKWSR